MAGNEVVKSIQDKYEELCPYLNEKTRRIWAAIEAQSLGWGGISQVSRATGLSRTTIHAGIRLLSESDGSQTEAQTNRIREVGGGRKLLEEQDPMLLGDLESLIEPMTLGVM
jgi:biotin operon repressor